MPLGLDTMALILEKADMREKKNSMHVSFSQCISQNLSNSHYNYYCSGQVQQQQQHHPISCSKKYNVFVIEWTMSYGMQLKMVCISPAKIETIGNVNSQFQLNSIQVEN